MKLAKTRFDFDGCTSSGGKLVEENGWSEINVQVGCKLSELENQDVISRE